MKFLPFPVDPTEVEENLPSTQIEETDSSQEISSSEYNSTDYNKDSDTDVTSHKKHMGGKKDQKGSKKVKKSSSILKLFATIESMNYLNMSIRQTNQMCYQYTP